MVQNMGYPEERLADWIDAELARIKAAYPGGSSSRGAGYRMTLEEVARRLRHLYDLDDDKPADPPF
jgi:hypothetical protein